MTMATNYPAALDTTAELKNDAVDATTTPTTHRTAHNNVADAILAIETELGVLPKGSFGSVDLRLLGAVTLSPASSQTIQSGGDWMELALRGHASQTVRLFEAQDSGGTPLAWWDASGNFSAQGLKVSGSPLASTHLSDTASLLREPSPSITTPSISTPTLTGVPTAPTAAVDTNTTQVATTAYVINQGYAKPASPAFTGNPTAPTAAVGTDTTQIATTAYVAAEIESRKTVNVPPGAVMPYGGSSAPADWLLCDGTAVSRTTYASLYAIVGTTYGAGDGSTTFNLPDLRGRMAVGKGTHADVSTLGANEGVAVASRRPKHTHGYSLGTDNVGSHNHGSGSGSSDGDHSHSGSGTTGTVVTSTTGGVGTTSSSGVSTDSAGSHSHGASINGVGGHSHSVTGSVGVAGMAYDTPAYQVTNFVIKT